MDHLHYLYQYKHTKTPIVTLVMYAHSEYPHLEKKKYKKNVKYKNQIHTTYFIFFMLYCS